MSLINNHPSQKMNPAYNEKQTAQHMKKLQDKSIDWSPKLKEAQKGYKFQPQLTPKLDNYLGEFTETTILEIVLWKTNRYPTITDALLRDINDLRKTYTEEKAKILLRQLLNLNGFDLPMASTVLRFACADKLQIIDKRVYRLITPNKDHLKIPHNIEEKITLYFDYIERLKIICQDHNIPFPTADRVLYQLDKTENNNIPISY